LQQVSKMESGSVLFLTSKEQNYRAARFLLP